MTFRDREGLDVEALRTDRYLESLLAAHDRRATHTPADSELDPAIREAATRLGRDLVRLHPSFRFEERLAARLAQVAAAMRLPAAAGAEGAAIGALPGALPAPFAGVPVDPFDGDVDDLVDPDQGGNAVPPIPRPILIGGALTSAALSLAGAAWVAWRRTRPSLSPMARAVRAARQSRVAGPTRPGSVN